MSAPNRSALIEKTYKALKKQYKPVAPPERSLLEHLLFASLLENSSFESAEKSLAEIRKSFHDLNEVRVSSVAELSEHTGGLHDGRTAAFNFRRVLHSMFEATYSFDAENLKKKTLGQAIKDLQKYGCTPFVVAYATQAALGGHAIPIDKGAMDALEILGIVSAKEAAAGEIPGLERAVPKNRGVEFGSLLHQLGVDLLARPFSPEVREFFLAINPECKDRLPKRTAKKEEPKREERPAAKPVEVGIKPQKVLPVKPLPAKTATAAKGGEPAAAKPAGKPPEKPGDKTDGKGGAKPVVAKPPEASKVRGAQQSKPGAKPDAAKDGAPKDAAKRDAVKAQTPTVKPARPAKLPEKSAAKRLPNKGLSKTKPR